MREYKVTVDGTEFHVCVEPAAAGSAPVAAAAPAAPAPAPKASGAAVSVAAPMPGNVLDIKVKVGDSVKSGQVVAVLEAMKMEIEVTSTADGTVQSIAVAKGATVNTGDTVIVVA